MARDLSGWFVRRAGLARVTTLACGLGLGSAGLVGSHIFLAVVMLSTVLLGLLVSTVLGRDKEIRKSTPAGFRGRARSAAGRFSGWSLIGMVLVGLFSGYLLGSVRVAQLLDGGLLKSVGSDIQTTLVVTGPVKSSGGWESAAAFVRGADPERVWLEVPPSERSSGEGISQGSILEFSGKILRPEGSSDTGFDQAKYLRTQGIQVVLRAAEPTRDLGRRGGISGLFDRLRVAARSNLSRGPDARIDEVFQGIVTGDTSGLDKGWLEAFRRSGTAHMLSVSGLHVASIAAIMLGLSRLLRLSRRVGFALAASAAVLLIPFVGASAPVVRSVAMILIVLAGRLFGRNRDQWQVLGFAAIVVLVSNPLAVFDVGFQLSFAAFSGMLAFIALLEKVLAALPRAVRSSLAVSFAATLGTAPVSLMVFGQTSLVAPVANLLVIPLLPFVTALGMASIPFGFVWAPLSTALDWAASPLLALTVRLSELFALAPTLPRGDLGRASTAVTVSLLSLPVALALCGKVVRTPFALPLPFFRRSIRCIYAHRPRGRASAVCLTVLVATAGLCLGWFIYPVLAGSARGVERAILAQSWPDQVEVRMLDVGQGNAVLVRTPERHALLFDAGPEGCGLCDQLEVLGVSRLNLVLISHPHADHFAGLHELFDVIEVDEMIDHVTTSPVPAQTQTTLSAAERGAEALAYLDLRGRLAEEGTKLSQAKDGLVFQVDGVTVRLRTPPEPIRLCQGPDPWLARGGPPSGDQLNAVSIVACLTVEGRNVVLPGDAEADALAGYQLGQADILVVPHHGSRGGLTNQLLDRLGPKLALISVGESNSFGHPDPATLELLSKRSIPVLRADSRGWVSCIFRDRALEITTEKPADTAKRGD